MKRRRKYDKAFKMEVVKRSLEDISLQSLSDELGIHKNVISRWRKEYLDTGEELSFPGNGNEVLSEEQKEIKDLKKALKEKELELEILKKAINIFSKKDRMFTIL